MKKKIFIIDDDQDLLRFYQVMLESNDFTVTTFSNSKYGFEKLMSEKPDLLILDVMMSTDLDGYNTLHKIKENPSLKDLPVIMLTGMIDSLGVNLISGVEDDKLLPNVKFRNKPIEPNALVELINEMIK